MRFKIPGREPLAVEMSRQGLTFKAGVMQPDGHWDRSEFTVPRAVVLAAGAVASTGAFVAITSAGVPTVAAAATVAAARGLVPVDGYYREDGTYVRGHNRTPPDGWEGNNFTG